MSAICFLFKDKVFPNNAIRVQRQIEELDISIVDINNKIFEKRKKLKDLKENINLLEDPGNKVDVKNSSRKRLVETTKMRMGMICKHIKELEDNLSFFEKSKYVLENNQMTKELTEQITKLKMQLSSVTTIDVENLVKSAEEVSEVHADLEDVHNKVRITMNAWNSDVDVDMDDVDAYLRESNDEEEEEVTASKIEMHTISDHVETKPNIVLSSAPIEPQMKRDDSKKKNAAPFKKEVEVDLF